MVVCALSLAVALLLELPAGANTPDRDLYRGAASAIEQRHLPRACELLQRLVTDYPQSELAELAAYHLAECLLLDGHPDRALDTLAHWTARIEQQAREPLPLEQLADSQLADSQKHSTLALSAASLLRRVLDDLDDTPATRTSMENLLDLAEAQRSISFTTTLLGELAQRSQKVGDFVAARSFLHQAIEACQVSDFERSSQLRTRLYFDLPLAWAEQELSKGHAATAVDLLTQGSNSRISDTRDCNTESAKAELANESSFEFSSEQQLARRFLLAEALFAAGRTVQATEQFDWLTAQAAGISPKPPWLAAIALRRGELLIRARDTTAAQRWLLQAKSDHVDFERAYEFDYLLARCAVARIELEEACELLQDVIEAGRARATEAVPRATWMLGEVHFLQRHYRQAMQAYAAVAQMSDFPDWQARALLQSAKCHELLGHSREASIDYQQALQLSEQPEIQQQAIERLSALESLAPTLR